MIVERGELVDWTRRLLKMRKAEADKLDWVHQYWRGSQPLPVTPRGVPVEVKKMAQMSRVNVLGLVVDVLAQSLYVVGYREEGAGEDEATWETWQANALDAHQTGVHRGALGYGTSYVLVLPGDSSSVIRGVSPRRLTALYGDDPEWPEVALEVRSDDKGNSYRLYDGEAIWFLDEDKSTKPAGQDWNPVFTDRQVHGIGVCPAVRFRNHDDLDDEVSGEIEPLIPLQDQIDFTTFDLLVAQHFQSFRQRYVLGWTSESETEKAKAAASRLWTFDDPAVKVGEFGQVDLKGYLESRESTLQHLATISQTPPHHLLGKLVNLSAEALAAAEAGQRRKIAEREVLFGESWEQALALAARFEGRKVSEGAQVRWRDTEARALASTVDALGKMAQMLNVPPAMLWEKIPGWTQQDVERAKAEASAADSIGSLTDLLDRQMGEGGDLDTTQEAELGKNLRDRVEAATALIRAGFDPAGALAATGVDPIKHTGLVPITVKDPDEEGAAAKT